MQAIDNSLLGTFIAAGTASPVLFTGARWLTGLGGALWLSLLSGALVVLLLVRGHPRHAAAFLLVTLSGRAVVELLKWSTDRPRPELIPRPVVVHSLSFPSGHAANSMLVYLSIALIVAPLLVRGKWPTPTAVLLSLAIGLTRPLLGVHWPSDVLAGWALAVAWTLSSVWLLEPWMGGRRVRR